jgi:hypothetical protein
MMPELTKTLTEAEMLVAAQAVKRAIGEANAALVQAGSAFVVGIEGDRIVAVPVDEARRAASSRSCDGC